jgi:hypothetical protein
MDLIVVDGPNLYNMVANQLATYGEGAKTYLLDWFDIDRLVIAATGLAAAPAMGTVVFHSELALGRGAARLTADETDRFWARQGANPDTSTMLVSLPGRQRERQEVSCEKCQAKVMTETRGEKGVDTSIVTYLFETERAWSSLYLVARDVDYAPAVEAFRRRGKRVFVVAPLSERVTALERVAQSVTPWPADFLADDISWSRFLCLDGGLDKLIAFVGARACAVDIGRWDVRAPLSVEVGFVRDGLDKIELQARVSERLTLPKFTVGDGDNFVSFAFAAEPLQLEAMSRVRAGRGTAPGWLAYKRPISEINPHWRALY